MKVDQPKQRPSIGTRVPDDQTPRERAEFLAREISSDVMAPEAEIADAIEREIMRFVSEAGPSGHPDDVCVDQFAAAMKIKLARKRDEGYGGWETCSTDRLAELLIDHLKKGDPIDVANFAMMLFHGEREMVGNGPKRALARGIRESRAVIVSEFITSHLAKEHGRLLAIWRNADKAE